MNKIQCRYLTSEKLSSDNLRLKRIESIEKTLNDLVGKKFLVGEVELEGIDLCRPCRHLCELLDQDNIIKEFLRRGGLRCQILTSSNISVGDEIKLLD